MDVLRLDLPDQGLKWRLHLDITALLLAHHLGILPIVEQAFAPLHIPAALIPAMIGMLDRLQHHQPARLQMYQQIVDLVQQGHCQVEEGKLTPAYENIRLVEELGAEWVTFFEGARANSGYLVHFLPLQKRDLSGPPTALPEEAFQYVVNCRAIVETLYQQGPLSAEDYGRALRALGQARHLNETELCNSLKDQLVGIAKVLAKRHTDAIESNSGGEEIFSEPGKAGNWLLEWALNLCRVAPSLPDTIAEFVALLTRLVEAWPFMGSVCKPIVQGFAEELPVSYIQPFWSLLVRLRAA